MKLKNLYRPLIVIATAGILFVACKKSSSTDNRNTPSHDVQTQATDQATVYSENDAVTNDVSASIDGQAGISNSAPIRGDVQTDGPHQVNTLICDATVTVDTTVNPWTVTITYNGTNCKGNRTRTGTVVVSVPAGVKWSDKGAVVTVSIQNLKITRVADGKSITLNGTHTYTNVTGGSLWNLASLGTITHTVTSNDMTISFANGTQRSWSVARQRVFTYNGGGVITQTRLRTRCRPPGMTVRGASTCGYSFVAVFPTPVSVRQSPDPA